MTRHLEASAAFLYRSSRAWLRGLWESLQVQRSVNSCIRNATILKKCLSSALINGVVFYGSVLWANHILQPAVRVILRAGLAQLVSETKVEAAAGVVMWIFHLGWIFPVYLISFIVSVMWSQDVADLAFASDLGAKVSGERRRKKSAAEKIFDKLCTMLLLSIFWMEKHLVGYIPIVGTSLQAIMFAWLMAFYCFDYGWCIQETGLQDRIVIFESNWAFFWGFGTPLALILQFTSFYTSAMWLGALFPLSVLVACGTDTAKVEGFNCHVRSKTVQGDHISLLSIFGVSAHIVRFIMHLVLGNTRMLNIMKGVQ